MQGRLPLTRLAASKGTDTSARPNGHPRASMLNCINTRGIKNKKQYLDRGKPMAGGQRVLTSGAGDMEESGKPA